MRKILFLILLMVSSVTFGQLSLVNVGTAPGSGNGDPLRTGFEKVNSAITQINTNTAAILLKAPINNFTGTGLTILESLKVGGSAKVQIDSITSDGTNVYFWHGASNLTAVPGVGSASWGSISGSWTNQIDLLNAMNLKANAANAAFSGTTTGITAAMTGAMATSHAANAITGTNITNWNTAYGWGNHASAGYALSSSLTGYVPTTTTVNGHMLTTNVLVTASDLSLDAVNNTSDLNKPISTLTQAALDLKQNLLVSGVNIKTIGEVSILGMGDIPISGTGTVTSVGVTSANGVSASIATATTTPNLTFTLGAITPASVNGITLSGSSTPVLAVTGTSAISGTNTGDNAINTRYSSLVTNATHTGDVTGSTGLTIASGVVTLAKMANMATGSLIYRKTAATGVPEVQTLATLKTDLGLVGSNTGDQTNITGNAATATKLAATVTINGTAFDGSTNISVPSNITPGTTGNVLTSNGSVWTSATSAGGSGTWGSLTGDINDQDDLMAIFHDTVSAETTVPLLSDTIPLFTIGGGNNLTGSQSSFLPDADLGGFSNVSVKDTVYITSGRFFVAQDSGTVTMGFKFYKHATTYPTTASTDMMSNVITLSATTNATTTGTVITHTSTPHFDVITLLPGESIAAIVTVKSNGNMPKLMRGTVYGYKQNRTY